ncbi:LPXTG cell wall anchor domain-containing protein [Micromonospora sp. WMMD812]|uniref:LPXTG cell wall anchor domain-containing protein n=1 Tax=Micromonospora sp. WMMD812 TaxID=3015152 RepID=UPI00248D2101|nr:LPXTG cell wall anchor domain-containing protein [Micromonospora sp. WMMD812]WBB65440.1 LPXTG cell wall anchor domain-containing protein [Micromonospora sp. WMMD812]
MTPFHRSALARAGVVALLAAGGMTAATVPAYAADQADIALVPISYELAKGVKAAKAKPFKFTVQNLTESVDAKAVTVTVDTAGLKKNRVGFVVPDGCEMKGSTFTCLLGDLRGGTSEDFGLPLFSTGGRGDAGTLKVTISAANAEADTVDHDITVAKPGYDLTAWVQDVQANVVVNGAVADEPDLKPVPRGETVPLDWAVYNDGSRKATGIFYGLTLPAGVSFAQKPQGCVEQEILGKAQLLCENAGAVLKPGEYYTADVRVKVGQGVTEPVLKEGDLFAYGLDGAEGPAEEEPEVATQAQRRTFTEADEGDNHATFEAFVDLSAQPTPTPTPTPGGTASPGTGGGAGGGGGLPVTGVQAGLIGGIGAAVLLAGGALLLLSRRRKVVLVTPGDEKSTD